MKSLEKMGIMINSYDISRAVRTHGYNNECYFAIYDDQLIGQDVVKTNVRVGG
jgi:hypothetical protein